jgi:hypothetical protein
MMLLTNPMESIVAVQLEYQFEQRGIALIRFFHT